MRAMITSSSSADSATIDSSLIPKLPATLDTQGRLRATREHRQVILSEYKRSGVFVVQFAHRTGLKYSELAGRLQRCVG